MKNIKPVFVIRGENVEQYQWQAVLEGVEQLLKLAQMAKVMPIVEFSAWAAHKDEDTELLIGFDGVLECIGRSQQTNPRRDQVNGVAIVECLEDKVWRESIPHYDVLVLERDMYSGEPDNSFIIGVATSGIGAVISVYRYLQLERGEQYECIVTETMHEVGHVLGLVPDYRDYDYRDYNVEDVLGKHCTNICVMRQGLRVPADTKRKTRDRLKYGALCTDCQRNLREFFS